MLQHGSVAARDGEGVLLLGPSGAGKSDLLIRLLDSGWTLVTDDQVLLRDGGGRLLAAAPERLRGTVEVRGIGLLTGFPTAAEVPLCLAVDCAARAEVPRLPSPAASRPWAAPSRGSPCTRPTPRHPGGSRSRSTCSPGAWPAPPARWSPRRDGPGRGRGPSGGAPSMTDDTAEDGRAAADRRVADRRRAPEPFEPPGSDRAPTRRAMVVTGLSGAGKASVLRVLEDLGHETVDNPPLSVLADLFSEAGDAPLALGIDARSRGLDAALLVSGLDAIRARGAGVEIVFVTADEDVLLRRYSETRRRHPLAPGGALGNNVADGIAREEELLAPLRAAADLLIDTSSLAVPDLRRIIERRYGADAPPLSVAVMSFGYPKGLPREADLVLDLRFLRNPHYEQELRPMTGRDAPIAAYVTADPAWEPFWRHMTALLDPLLPAYAAGGKKYLTVALGCTGGKHRSVLTAERLARHLVAGGWPVDLIHRELSLRESLKPPSSAPLASGSGGAYMTRTGMPQDAPGGTPDLSGPEPDPLPARTTTPAPAPRAPLTSR
ncbi:RNase adapter RapZ [Roseomonas sp. CCTCC AB2023176]|uniref:RNase adapter RapZ n=1 Tax=Roseomonas sp. CCTCC AB2023176 TaxID=3342640 RepID=UPI0035DCADE6